MTTTQNLQQQKSTKPNTSLTSLPTDICWTCRHLRQQHSLGEGECNGYIENSRNGKRCQCRRMVEGEGVRMRKEMERKMEALKREMEMRMMCDSVVRLMEPMGTHIVIDAVEIGGETPMWVVMERIGMALQVGFNYPERVEIRGLTMGGVE